MNYSYFIEYAEQDSDIVLDYLANDYDGFHGQDWDYEYEDGTLIIYSKSLDIEDLLGDYFDTYPVQSGRL